MRLKLTLAYDGTGFRGWARQPGRRTVEGELSGALARLYDASGELAVAGRTDTGVHALANVVSVEVEGGPPAERAAEALNARAAARRRRSFGAEAAPTGSTPASTRARARIATASGAAASRSPFEARRSLWHPRPLDLDALNENAPALRRRARVPRVHADRDAAHGVRPHGRATRAGSSSTSTRSRSRSPRTRSCATWSRDARRDSMLERGPTSSRRCLAGGRAAEREPAQTAPAVDGALPRRQRRR